MPYRHSVATCVTARTSDPSGAAMTSSPGSSGWSRARRSCRPTGRRRTRTSRPRRPGRRRRTRRARLAQRTTCRGTRRPRTGVARGSPREVRRQEHARRVGSDPLAHRQVRVGGQVAVVAGGHVHDPDVVVDALRLALPMADVGDEPPVRRPGVHPDGALRRDEELRCATVRRHQPQLGRGRQRTVPRPGSSGRRSCGRPARSAAGRRPSHPR